MGLIDGPGVLHILIEFWPTGLRAAGSSPVILLQRLYELQYMCSDLHRDVGQV